MGITKKMLEDLGLTAEQVNSVFAERGKEIADEKAKVEAIEKKNTDFESQITELSEKIKGYDGTEGKLKELTEKVGSYEKEKADREQAEAQAKIDKEFSERFNALVGENKFKHPDVAEGRLNAFKKEVTNEANKTKSDKEIFEAITLEQDCFVNPQQGKISLPGGSISKPTDKGFKSFF